ncbi:MAG: FmdB family transcriptional regulator, partial [Actinobacteria bacterium]|nr:FmdB family transcriptional regulator [Actinomycetota bacterium]
KSPVEKVLYPVSVHFKGSGFYSTDYGRGGRKKTDPSRDGAEAGASEKKADSDSGTSSGEKKAAAAD